jgi:hypothetical protein
MAAKAQQFNALVEISAAVDRAARRLHDQAHADTLPALAQFNVSVLRAWR